jgi:ABC-type uncharacterized transport system permease subunit
VKRELEGLLIDMVIVEAVRNLIVYSVRRKWLAESPWMTLLAAAFRLLAAINFLFGRFNNIAGWRFRGIRRVLLRLRELQFQLFDFLLKPLYNGSKFRDNLVLARHTSKIQYVSFQCSTKRR